MKVIANEPRNRVFEFDGIEQVAMSAFDALLDGAQSVTTSAALVGMWFPDVSDEFLSHISDGTVPDRATIRQAFEHAMPWGAIGCGCCQSTYCSCGAVECDLRWSDDDEVAAQHETLPSRTVLANSVMGVVANLGRAVANAVLAEIEWDAKAKAGTL